MYVNIQKCMGSTAVEKRYDYEMFGVINACTSASTDALKRSS